MIAVRSNSSSAQTFRGTMRDGGVCNDLARTCTQFFPALQSYSMDMAVHKVDNTSVPSNSHSTQLQRADKSETKTALVHRERLHRSSNLLSRLLSSLKRDGDPDSDGDHGDHDVPEHDNGEAAGHDSGYA